MCFVGAMEEAILKILSDQQKFSLFYDVGNGLFGNK